MEVLAPLSDRVAAALTGPASSPAVSALISEATAHIATLKARIDEAERVSLDPLATDDKVEAAADEVIRLGLAIRRQESALQALDKRLSKATSDEKQAEAGKVYEAAVSRRDAAAKALREDYPRLSGELAALARQLAQAEAEVRAANQSRPEDRPHIVGPEEMVRGVPPNGMANGITFPKLLDRLYLPNLDRHEQAHGNPMWSPDKVATA